MVQGRPARGAEREEVRLGAKNFDREDKWAGTRYLANGFEPKVVHLPPAGGVTSVGVDAVVVVVVGGVVEKARATVRRHATREAPTRDTLRRRGDDMDKDMAVAV
jgi:hypothetical protein